MSEPNISIIVDCIMWGYPAATKKPRKASQINEIIARIRAMKRAAGLK